jgi:hypothetical protein
MLNAELPIAVQIQCLIAGVDRSVLAGTTRTFRDIRMPVGIGGKADVERVGLSRPIYEYTTWHTTSDRGH